MDPDRPDIDQFVEKTKALLELERTEEIAQTEALLNSLSPKVFSSLETLLIYLGTFGSRTYSG